MANKDIEKYENYKDQISKLNKAIDNKFYYEAIFIEYAIMEDRLQSVLTYLDAYNPKKQKTMHQKLNQISSLIENNNATIGDSISTDLITKIMDWKNERNNLIHGLLSEKPSNEGIIECATTGFNLVRKIDNAVDKVKRKTTS